MAVASPAKAQDNKTVYVIDKKATHQVIDNFGASDAWRCNFIGKYWPEEKREKIADLLFKREFDEKGNPIGMALTNWSMSGRNMMFTKSRKRTDESRCDRNWWRSGWYVRSDYCRTERKECAAAGAQ